MEKLGQQHKKLPKDVENVTKYYTMPQKCPKTFKILQSGEI